MDAKVESLAHDPITVSHETSPHAAMETMDQAGIRHLPVVADGKLVGIVSDRDLLEVTGWLPERIYPARGPGTEPIVPRVGRIMHSPVHVAAVGETAETAMETMLAHEVGCLPVLSGRGGDELVGIVTEADLLRAWLEDPGSEHDSDAVREWMSTQVLSLDLEDTLETARRVTRERHVRHLPVLENGLLIGIVSDRDLRRAVGCGRTDEFPVKDLMTREVVSVTPNAPLAEASRYVVDHRIGSLPVVEDGGLIGILTTTDLLRACATRPARA